jgi:ubiquinone/menaquinone biosynthesis C-methylase UbiE
MNFLTRRHLVAELMDDPAVDVAQLHDALRFIRKINTRLGYNKQVVARVLHGVEPTQHLTVLDVATGSADLPEALCKAHARCRVVGLDNHASTLDFARRMVRDSRIELVTGDAMNLPFEDRSMDCVTSTLFLHHLPEELIVTALKEMKRVSRGKIVIADLIRSKRAYAWITLFTMGSSKMIRHDARASVRHALTMKEMMVLCERAGLSGAVITRTFGHRMLVEWRRAK